eukprot:GHVP01007851.1.p1 GENE.GHVP01007851.1~~GHVP01007851.1.p1  ORF type:complete len:184 (+),score=19.55 GHVP01007851.1:632-1183(+)
MQQYELEIRHFDGKLNCVADWLSRSYDVTDANDDEADEMSPTFYIAPASVDLGARLPVKSDLLEAYSTCNTQDIRDTYKNSEGILFHIRTNKIFIPPKWRLPVIYWFHFSKFGGHHGIGKTKRRIARSCWWPNIAKDVQSAINNCLPCKRHRPNNIKSLRGILSKPMLFQMLSLDYIGSRARP